MSKRQKKQGNINLLSLVFAILVVLSYRYYKDNQNTIIDNNNVKNIIPTSDEVTSSLDIYFLDVGQADSILISNNNHYMLIDAGNNEDGKHIVDYLKKDLNITKLDYVIGTHPHEDHIGGLDDIIDNFSIENILLPNVITTTKTFEDVLTSLEKKSLEISIPLIGDTFALGEAHLEIIYTGTDEENLNDSSIVLMLSFGNQKYLFMGDATSKVEKTILDNNLDIDVLKVGHHGSEYSTSDKFLEKTTPEYAIISVGAQNSYNHPSVETLKRIQKYTDKIYLTSKLGTIKLTSDGININVTNFKTNTNGTRS